MEPESSLTNSADAGQETVIAEPASPILPTEPQVPQAAAQPAVGKPEAQGFDYEWWKKDPRYGKIWKTDRDVIKSAYESDKILETKYKPAHKQYEDMKNRIKSLGYDPEKVDDFFNEVKSYKDPNNPVINLGNYLYQWKDDPLIGEIDKFFADLNVRKMQRDFPNMSVEQINQFKAMQEEIKAIKEEKQNEKQAQSDAKQKELVEQLKGEIAEETNRIEEEAKALGFEFTDEIRHKLYDYGIQESLSPKHLKYAFKELFKDDIAKLSENKLKSKVQQERDVRSKTKVPFGMNPNRQSPIKKNFTDRLQEMLTKST